jgi:pyruvate dehydrogenase kinase 2/3/4
MKRLASALHKSSRGRVQWSLRELARLGQNLRDDTTTTIIHVPNASTAGMLLHDVSLRLADQYHVCQDLLTSIHEMDKGGDDAPTSCRKGVIRAVNTNLALLGDWKRAQTEQQDRHRCIQKALRNVQNLQRLHEDTFHLTFGLMEENSNVLFRFTNADRHLTFATMEQVRSRHASTVETLADIVLDLRQSNLRNPKFDNLVDVFLRNRLGVQLLCDHYVSLHKGKTTNGGVSVDCKLIDVVDDAVTEAKHICDAHYENVPQVHVNIPANAQITLIRPWVHHALVELLKNAMASSFAKTLDNEAPLDILVELNETASEFVVLNVLDQGTGVQHVDEAFAFASSSAESRWDRLDEQQSYAMVRSPLQSLGVGLPLSRMMMQHFGGDLTLSNRKADNNGGALQAGGCTATIYLSTNDSIVEQLPETRNLE